MSGLSDRLINANWFKSSYSSSSSGCVEIAMTGSAIGVRDTKNRSGGTLVFHSRTWSKFIDDLKR